MASFIDTRHGAKALAVAALALLAACDVFSTPIHTSRRRHPP